MRHASDVLIEVSEHHYAGKHVRAADTLLNYLVDLLDANDMAYLNDLVQQLETSLANTENTLLYDDYGLARIHNVLALTSRHQADLPGRSKLRTTYHDAVARREGTLAADSTIQFL